MKNTDPMGKYNLIECPMNHSIIGMLKIVLKLLQDIHRTRIKGEGTLKSL